MESDDFGILSVLYASCLLLSGPQVWLTLYQLLIDSECLQKYDFNSRNKTVLLKARESLLFRCLLNV